MSPEELLSEVGIDITDPAWMRAGFTELERMVRIAEEPPQPRQRAG